MFNLDKSKQADGFMNVDFVNHPAAIKAYNMISKINIIMLNYSISITGIKSKDLNQLKNAVIRGINDLYSNLEKDIHKNETGNRLHFWGGYADYFDELEQLKMVYLFIEENYPDKVEIDTSFLDKKD